MDEKEDKEDYEIGYGKPPQHSQFKKGQSGNPTGRPRKDPTLAESCRKILNKRVTFKLNGTPRKLVVRDAIAMTLASKASSGDVPAAKFLMSASESGKSDSGQALPLMIDGLRAMHAKHEAADAASAKMKDQEGEVKEDA
jgi:hypothetical protein